MATKDEISTAIEDAGGTAHTSYTKAELLDELRRVAPTHNFLTEADDGDGEAAGGITQGAPGDPAVVSRGIPDKRATVVLGTVGHAGVLYEEGDAIPSLPGPTALSLEAQGVVRIEGDADGS